MDAVTERFYHGALLIAQLVRQLKAEILCRTAHTTDLLCACIVSLAILQLPYKLSTRTI